MIEVIEATELTTVSDKLDEARRLITDVMMENIDIALFTERELGDMKGIRIQLENIAIRIRGIEEAEINV